MRDAIVPEPFVVRPSVVSCETTTAPSRVTPTSSSSMSAPARTERLNAYSVFDGNSSSPPWCAMLSTRFSSHGFCAAAGAAGSSSASASAATRRIARSMAQPVRFGDVSVEFLLTSLVIVATPGTGVLYTLAAGLARGARASVVAAFACTLGIVPHMIAAITGLAALLHTSALAFQFVKYLGVAYLLYLAWSMFREHGALTVEEEATPRSARQVIVAGVLINILNPKLTIFFFAFLPQFVTAGETGSLLHMTELSMVFMLMTFVVFVGYGLFAAAVRRHVIARPQVLTWLRRTFAASFVALGAKLALTAR